jgi:hypothetical protein
MAEVNPVAETGSVLTEEEKRKVLQEFHEQPIGGHLGMNRTFDRLEEYISWPGMKKEIEDYVRQCEICQKNKITQNKTKLPLHITDTPDVVWQKCSLDIVGPLTPTLQDSKYLLAFQDGLSKFTVGVPLKQQDAMTLARAFVEEIILIFGIPQVLLTDQSSNFLSKLFSNVCKLLRVKRIKTMLTDLRLTGHWKECTEFL